MKPKKNIIAAKTAKPSLKKPATLPHNSGKGISCTVFHFFLLLEPQDLGEFCLLVFFPAKNTKQSTIHGRFLLGFSMDPLAAAGAGLAGHAGLLGKAESEAKVGFGGAFGSGLPVCWCLKKHGLHQCPSVWFSREWYRFWTRLSWLLGSLFWSLQEATDTSQGSVCL